MNEEIKLPKLPETEMQWFNGKDRRYERAFSAYQMEAYARAAVALNAPASAAVTELDFLSEWLMFDSEPQGVECCGRGHNGDCCGNPDIIYRKADELAKSMGARHRELVAALSQGGKP